jgi:cell wall-associated NlpC family hydrolase
MKNDLWFGKYMNIEFAEKGRTIEGLDCWGLVQLVYKHELGIELPDYLECYETTNDRDKLAEVINKESDLYWKHPKLGEEKEFDIIILNMRGVPMHVGIVTKQGYMIHCAKGINTVHENYKNMRWANKIKGFARYDGRKFDNK